MLLVTLSTEHRTRIPTYDYVSKVSGLFTTALFPKCPFCTGSYVSTSEDPWGRAKRKAPGIYTWKFWLASTGLSPLISVLHKHPRKFEGHSGLALPDTVEYNMPYKKGSKVVVTCGKGKKLVRTSEKSDRQIYRHIFLSLLKNVSSMYITIQPKGRDFCVFAHVLQAPKTVSNAGQITINIC